ncbi:MAG: CAP domain-containing protein [Armatimonadota bacterium]|nr:CAP domain-containing protein [bacterium]
MTKLSLYLATLLLGTNFSASTMPTSTPPAAVSSVQMNAVEQQCADLVNAERWDRNLRVLSPNPVLVQVAREHSKEMYEKNYFDHTSPTPGLKTPMNRYLKQIGHTPTWAYLGENLFYCSIVDVQRGHQCLMNSEKHRDNILNDRFEQIGVGVYVAPNGQFYVTQLFLAQID